MRKVIVALAMTAAVAGCTTTERDVGTGAALGAAAGAIIGGDVGSAVVGAAAGAAAGAFVRYAVRDGYCVYRAGNGRLYEDRCRR